MVPNRRPKLSRLLFGLLALGLLLSGCSGDTTNDAGTPCSIDDECGIGEYCKEGYCTPFGGDKGPQFCDADNDCEEGQICEQGICVPGERQDGSDGAVDGGDRQPDGGGDTTDSGDLKPQIALGGDVTVYEDDQGKIYEINYGSVTVGSPVERTMVIRNSGQADLEVSVVTLTEDPGGEFEITPSVPPALVIGPGEEESLVVTYQAKDGLTDRAVAKVFSNDPDEGEIDVQLVSEFKGEARIYLDPPALDFGAVSQGQSTTLPLTITNQGTGNAVLTIESVEPEVGIQTAYEIELEDPNDQSVLTPPVFINRGDFITAQVTFLAPARGSFNGNLIIVNSDQAASPATVALIAAAGIPSLTVEPENVEFGMVAATTWAADETVTLRNDGYGDLTITSIELAAGSSTDILLEDIPAPLPAQALVLAPEEFATLTIRYYPAEIGTDMATILVAHDAPEAGQELQVLISGEGFQGNARPTAVIKADGQDTALIRINLNEQVILDGSDSFDTDGTVEGYLWELIEQPSIPKCGSPFTLSNIYNDVTSIIPTEAGLTRIGLTVTDNSTADSNQDILDIQVAAKPEAKIKEGGNDTGFVEVDMGESVVFDATQSSDCDGAVLDYLWTIESYPAGRGAPPNIGGGDLYATIIFDFPGDYEIGLVVKDNDSPQNSSDMATFDVLVKGPKAFRVTLDWYNQDPAHQNVDVDMHLLKPGSTDTCAWNEDPCSEDDCCPDKGGVDDCHPNPDWGILGSPYYGTDNYEDPDGAVDPPGNFGDEISFIAPGMGDYKLFVYFRCHSSSDTTGYICCDDFLFYCPISIACDDRCDRAAAGIVRFFVTDYNDQETEVTQKTFGYSNGQVKTFFQVGTISWPNGTLQ
ncbi:MAG: choice-of-anchor D domain-containing protein [Deltaproteobacteria bacterium]|nr:choice-of-anchor D domain-containing protein [Deltaproteobacteria bacterium]